MKSEQQSLLQKAKNYAFLLLKYRLRSEKELSSRLKQKSFSPEVIKKTLSFLKEKKFIDDNYFTKSWIEARLKKSLGPKRIRQELRLKGIDRELIDSYLAQLKEDYPEEEVVTRLALKKLNRLKHIESVKAKRRTFDFLLRRGFSYSLAMAVINKLCKQIY